MKIDEALIQSENCKVQRITTLNEIIRAKVNRNGVLCHIDVEGNLKNAVSLALISKEDWEPVIELCKSCNEFSKLQDDGNYLYSSAVKRLIQLTKKYFCTCKIEKNEGWKKRKSACLQLEEEEK